MVYFIDCTMLQTREQAHEYMARTLGFPGYYGKNLDALYDCLTDMRDDEIILCCPAAAQEALGDYGQAIIDTFRDAAESSERLCVTLRETRDGCCEDISRGSCPDIVENIEKGEQKG